MHAIFCNFPEDNYLKPLKVSYPNYLYARSLLLSLFRFKKWEAELFSKTQEKNKNQFIILTQGPKYIQKSLKYCLSFTAKTCSVPGMVLSAAGSKRTQGSPATTITAWTFPPPHQVEKLTWRKRHEIKIPANVVFMYNLACQRLEFINHRFSSFSYLSS